MFEAKHVKYSNRAFLSEIPRTNNCETRKMKPKMPLNPLSKRNGALRGIVRLSSLLLNQLMGEGVVNAHG